MNRRRNKRTQKNTHQEKVMTRCQLLLRPVWEHEVCADYKAAKDSHAQRCCRTCMHSY